jgi:hypothetical protein
VGPPVPLNRKVLTENRERLRAELPRRTRRSGLRLVDMDAITRERPRRKRVDGARFERVNLVARISPSSLRCRR